jgi:uncharacterized membrane protein YjjP (DUF1212 family)
MASEPESSLGFLIKLGRALHEAGFAAPELESALHRVARRLGVEAQFFSTPTSLFYAFGVGADQSTHLERVEPAGVDLGRLAELEALIDRVASGELDPGSAAAAIDRARESPPRTWRARILACWALSSAATAVFLGGGWAEVAVGGALGLATGVLATLLARRRESGHLFEPLAAALAAFVAAGAATVLHPFSVYIATLAGIIYLIPGFTLTVALTELATRHLSSGTARFASALLVFLTITFGTAVGSRVGEGVFGPASNLGPLPLTPWAEWVALVVAPLALSVLFRAPVRDAPWIVAVGALGFQGGRLGTEFLSPELGMFLGALAIGLASRLYARLTRRPEVIPLVPSILLLVPGSIGYRSFASLLHSDVVLGIETAFRMILVAVSLVAGLLLAKSLAPERR